MGQKAYRTRVKSRRAAGFAGLETATTSRSGRSGSIELAPSGPSDNRPVTDTLAPVAAPTRALDVARQLGPALIITAVIVGSGELIVTPKLGASAGFQLLWFIVLGCLLKVFVQIELGRHAVAHGMTTLQALATLPGPRLRVSWVLWLWLLMYVSLVFQVAGMVGGLASIFSLGGLAIPLPAIAALVGASCAVLLVWGRYRFVEGV